jgi:hypothetical protein
MTCSKLRSVDSPPAAAALTAPAAVARVSSAPGLSLVAAKSAGSWKAKMSGGGENPSKLVVFFLHETCVFTI